MIIDEINPHVPIIETLLVIAMGITSESNTSYYN